MRSGQSGSPMSTTAAVVGSPGGTVTWHEGATIAWASRAGVIEEDRAVLDVQRQRDERRGPRVEPPDARTMRRADLGGGIGQFRGQGTQRVDVSRQLEQPVPGQQRPAGRDHQMLRTNRW